MPGSDQFTAFGPAAVGFQTDGTEIDRGAEIAGNTFGVMGSGTVAGVIGQGVQDGVQGKGGSGRGGRFESDDLRPQIKLEPQPMRVEDVSRPAQPTQLTGTSLPIVGEVGDLWMCQIPGAMTTPAALWLCVFAGQTKDEPAHWCQVLLGDSVDGTMMPF